METRLARARAYLSDGLDALLFVSRPNILWVTGFTGTDAALIITRDYIRLFVDSRYTVQAELETSYDVQEINQKWEEIGLFLTERKISRIGFESNILDYDMALRLKEIFSGVDLVPAGSMLRDLRIIKDKSEVGKIIQAAKISENVMKSILEKGIRGRTERDVAIEIEYEMRRFGADGPSFETIVASGPRSAMPHAAPTDKIICRKEAVVFDFGCIFQGYCSDQTVTVFTGEPDGEFKEVYTKVWEAQQKAIEGIAPGKKATEIDILARGYLDENGLEHCYGHGTGHGVGIEVHEPPTISPRSGDSIKQGMVITIEPAAYYEGRFGVRIEDCLFVTDSSCKHLTNIAKGAIIIAD